MPAPALRPARGLGTWALPLGLGIWPRGSQDFHPGLGASLPPHTPDPSGLGAYGTKAANKKGDLPCFLGRLVHVCGDTGTRHLHPPPAPTEQPTPGPRGVLPPILPASQGQRHGLLVSRGM